MTNTRLSLFFSLPTDPAVFFPWSGEDDRVRSIPLLVKYDYNVADHPQISVFRPDAAKSVATRSP